jgi:CheY-like chemotaxis protein
VSFGIRGEQARDVLILAGQPLRYTLADRLFRLGHDPRLAGSLTEALALLDQREPDLVFLEVGGGAEGLVFLQLLRSRPETRHTPVLVTGAARRSREMEQAWRFGASGPLALGDSLDLGSWIRVATSQYAGLATPVHAGPPRAA